MTRYKIVCEYVGSAFSGWQKTAYECKKKPVQQVLEESLEVFIRSPVRVVGSSRTDSGVSALNQVAHFDIDKRISKTGEEIPLMDPDVMTMALNQNFQEYPLRVISTTIVDNTFHSRFSAKSRTYLYRMTSGLHRNQLPFELKDRVWAIQKTLDVDLMRQGADILTGRHNFNSFRSAKCQANNPERTISSFKVLDLPVPDVWRYNNPPKDVKILGLEIKARAFLHNQVRIMVSVLERIGSHEMTLDQLRDLIKAQDRQKAPATAPPFPLTLTKVSYVDDLADQSPWLIPSLQSSQSQSQSQSSTFGDLIKKGLAGLGWTKRD
ncbi:hypothetical protein SAMD00019534_103870 [Acytostelium subglobosum LB1]|uniref:hypothetical protein n=1 Tax=Acytostelium subglobosum LB1 TaxID=1410327 RepID=UPI0006449CD8|nr:hypothetical protein SAMD00019534_103870 [Acytostelium subglobosum LB1]GAM27212.1 hypothetical protein SAMD00019534_103870 [Acytostelium subglobosum LB1]|eukprot:XP_012749679.1 hypothetical protein SAMD00019534_103870 [Acytostelium subglobosum LB1]